MKYAAFFICITACLISPLTVAAFDLHVVPFTGELVLNQTDIHVPGARFPVQFSRQYVRGRTLSGAMGRGWAHSFEYALRYREHEQEVALILPDNRVRFFTGVQTEQGVSFRERAGDGIVLPAGAGYKLLEPSGFSYHFNAKGQLKHIENRYGHKLQFVYTDDRLVRVMGPLGTELNLSYNRLGQLASVDDAQGTRLTYEYSEDRLKNVIKNGKPLCTYSYGPVGMEHITVGPLVWTVHYDRSGKVARLITPYKTTLHYAYKQSQAEREFSVALPNEGKLVRRIRENGRVLEQIDGVGGTQTSRFAEDGRLLSTRDADGVGYDYQWSAQGQLEQIVNGLGQATRFKYQKGSQIPFRADLPNGSRTTFLNDPEKKLRRVTTEQGTQEIYEDEFGRIVEIRSGAAPMHIKYSGWLPTTVYSGKRKVISVEKNAAGRPAKVITSFGAIDLASKDTPVLKFDLADPQKRYPTADGRARYRLNSMGQVTHLYLPGGLVREFRYDPACRLTQVREDGRLVEAWSYSPAGRLKKQATGGDFVSYSYDSAGIISGADYSDGSRLTIEQLKGNSVETRVNGIVQKTTFDSAGRIIATSVQELPHPLGDSEPLKADRFSKVEFKRTMKNGVRTEKVKHAGDSSEYTYVNGLLQQIDSKRFGLFRYVHSDSGGRVAIEYPNGVTTEYLLDGQRLVNAVQVSGAAGSLFDSTLSRDTHGFVQQKTRNGEKTVFSYDKQGQLVKAGTRAFAYDSWGRITSVTLNGKPEKISVRKDGAPERTTLQPIGYDGCGRTALLGDARLKFSSDSRLVEYADKQGTIQFINDAEGKIISRSDGRSAYLYVYAGLNPVAEFSLERGAKKPQLEHCYLFAPGADRVLAMSRRETVVEGGKEKAIEKLYFFHRNERNDVVLVTDETGAEVSSYRYSPYGQLLSQTGNFESPFLFGGYRYDYAMQLYNLRSRLYSPLTRHFLSRDPIAGLADDVLTTNPYIYARNNPVNHIDPLGTFGFLASFSETLGSVGGSVTEFVVGKATDKADEYTDPQTIAENLTQKAIEKNPFLIGQSPGKEISSGETQAGIFGGFVSVVKNIFYAVDTQQKVDAGEMSHEDAAAESTGKIVETAAGAAFAPAGAVGEYAAQQLGKATEEGIKTYYAKAQADEAVRDAKLDDRRRVEAKFKQIHALRKKGDRKSLDEAGRLADGVASYTIERLSDKQMDIYYDRADKLSSQIQDDYAALNRRASDEFKREEARRSRAAEARSKREVVFEDVDSSQEARAKRMIAQEQERSIEAQEEEIGERTQQKLAERAAAWEAVGAGAQSIAAGLQEGYSAYQQRERELEASIAEHNRRMDEQVEAYKNSHQGPTATDVIRDPTLAEQWRTGSAPSSSSSRTQSSYRASPGSSSSARSSAPSQRPANMEVPAHVRAAADRLKRNAYRQAQMAQSGNFSDAQVKQILRENQQDAKTLLDYENSNPNIPASKRLSPQAKQMMRQYINTPID